MTKCNRSDEQLIDQFVTGARDDAENAFDVLVKRHGPMVLGTCRQILYRHQDAEDAFQTTFMTLAARPVRSGIEGCWHAGSMRWPIGSRSG